MREMSGDQLVSYNNLPEYRKSKWRMWIICQLFVFRDRVTGDLFPIFKCESCPEMAFLETEETVHIQDKAALEMYKCHHSRVCDRDESGGLGSRAKKEWAAVTKLGE